MKNKRIHNNEMKLRIMGVNAAGIKCKLQSLSHFKQIKASDMGNAGNKAKK